MFNISNIIMNQVPDADGNIIPASVQSGSAKLMGSLAIHQHILVAMEASSYNVSKATCWVYCLTCDGYTWGWLEASPFGVVVGGQTQENFYAYWDDDYEEDLTSDANQNQWTSGNTGVLRVTNSGVVSGSGSGSTWLDAYNPDEPVYVNQDCSEEYWMCPETYGTGGSGSGTAGDPTPVITSISPSVWSAGTTTPVTISGSGFGTNPSLTISGAGIVNYTITGAIDSEIDADVTISSSAPTQTVTVTVTSNGYNGIGFLPGPGGNSSQGSKNATVVTQPIPVHFRLTAAQDVGNGELDVTYQWDSSSNNLNDLSACTVGEFVQYPTPPGVDYQPATPPFPIGTYENPTIVSGSATAGGFLDRHKLPPGQSASSFVKPYTVSSFPANQYYWYECNGSDFIPLKSNLVITRSVSSNGSGGWMFTTSSNDTATQAVINPLP